MYRKGFEWYCLRLSRLFFIVYRDHVMATHQSWLFGIGNQFDKHRQVDFVLGKWKDTELPLIVEKAAQSVLAIKSFVLEGLGTAMTKYNG
jgi:peptidyl-tRNA hydrolase